MYEISCCVCGDKYIGETGRPLHIRIKEHLVAKSKSISTNALGKHRETLHGGTDFDIKVVLLAQQMDITARKTLEAFFIKYSQPALNNKDECIPVIQELSLFGSLCSF